MEATPSCANKDSCHDRRHRHPCPQRQHHSCYLSTACRDPREVFFTHDTDRGSEPRGTVSIPYDKEGERGIRKEPPYLTVWNEGEILSFFSCEFVSFHFATCVTSMGGVPFTTPVTAEQGGKKPSLDPGLSPGS